MMERITSKIQKEVYGELERLAKTMDVDTLSIYYFLSSQNSLVLFASYGLNKEAWGSRVSLNTGLVGKCAREKKPISVKNPLRHPEFKPLPGSGEENYKTFIAIPITDKGNLLGVLVIQTKNVRYFSYSQITKMYDIACDRINEIYKKIQEAYNRFNKTKET